MELSITFLKLRILYKNCFINKHCDFLSVLSFVECCIPDMLIFSSRLINIRVYIMQCYFIALDNHVVCHGIGLIL